MSEEQALLRAVLAEPYDSRPRLIYADWLEERSDKRGELIRIEEEMRTTPIYADRFWELKPRRNQLRASVNKRWLQNMRYGTDHEPVFREVPDGWKERWRLIREFTERWHGVPMSDLGGEIEVIARSKQRRRLRVNRYTGQSVEALEFPRIEPQRFEALPPSIRE